MLYDEAHSEKLRRWTESIIKEFKDEREKHGDAYTKQTIEFFIKAVAPLARDDDPLMQSIGQMAKFGIAMLCLLEETKK